MEEEGEKKKEKKRIARHFLPRKEREKRKKTTTHRIEEITGKNTFTQRIIKEKTDWGMFLEGSLLED